jgi:hypothetical protein
MRARSRRRPTSPVRILRGPRGPEYKAPWNQIFNNARVYTPEDRAIQTPNSDTPYSFVVADLRTGPLVLSVPPSTRLRYGAPLTAVQFSAAAGYVLALLV